jgi:hypothetical protein
MFGSHGIYSRLRSRLFVPERRLHKRASKYWHSLTSGGEIPRQEKFNFSGDEDFFSRGFLLSLTEVEPAFVHIGDILQDEAQIATCSANLHEVSASSLLGQFGRRYPNVLTDKQPFMSEYIFDTGAGFRVFCRGVLLPLSSTGETLDRIYGIVSWKANKTENWKNVALAQASHMDQSA